MFQILSEGVILGEFKQLFVCNQWWDYTDLFDVLGLV
jgi:hypothetical protein